MSKHWVEWSLDSTPQDIVESVMEVINDITREHNFQIDVNYDRDENLNYHVNFYEEKIKWKEKYGHQKKQKEQENF